MAVFQSDIAGNIESLNDLKKVQSYLYKLNEQLTYMFNNLTPDDNNASGVPKLTLVTDDKNQVKVEVSVDGVDISVGGVEEDDLIATINSRLTINHEGINIQSNGALTINTSQFKLDASGNATFGGTMNAGSININNGAFTVASNGSVVARDIQILNGVSTARSTMYFSVLLAQQASFGSVVADEIFPQNSWWAGWSLTATMKDVYSRLP